MPQSLSGFFETLRNKRKMTEEEAKYWDEYYTKNTIMPDLSKPGYFARKYGMAITLDPETTLRLTTYADTVHKSPAEIIAEMVKEKISVGI
jgi:NAD-specific glutamate dehydrogenase